MGLKILRATSILLLIGVSMWLGYVLYFTFEPYPRTEQFKALLKDLPTQIGEAKPYETWRETGCADYNFGQGRWHTVEHRYCKDWLDYLRSLDPDDNQKVRDYLRSRRER